MQMAPSLNNGININGSQQVNPSDNNRAEAVGLSMQVIVQRYVLL
jgi:hypothetical protein